MNLKAISHFRASNKGHTEYFSQRRSVRFAAKSAGAEGVLSWAGFETPSDAFPGKKTIGSTHEKPV